MPAHKQNICMRLYTAALFIIAKDWNNTNVQQEIKQTTHPFSQMQTHPHTHSHIKSTPSSWNSAPWPGKPAMVTEHFVVDYISEALYFLFPSPYRANFTLSKPSVKLLFTLIRYCISWDTFHDFTNRKSPYFSQNGCQ